mgnify:CR=1 FL=1
MNCKEIIMCILFILFLWILCPIFFFIEGFIRPCVVVLLVWKSSNCSKIRDLITSILVVFPGFMFMAFCFGFWAIVQLILNLIPYCTCVKKWQFTGDHIIGFLWSKDHVLHNIFIDLWGKVKGGSVQKSL